MSEPGDSSTAAHGHASSSSRRPHEADASCDQTEDLDKDASRTQPRRVPGPHLTAARVVTSYNHQQQQEIARRNIAYALICLVMTLALLSFIYLWTLPLNEHARKHVENLMLLMQLVFGPIITLAATAIGYYFGTNSRSGR